MAVFDYNFSKLSNSMQVELNESFKNGDIPQLMDFFREEMAAGKFNWEFNLKNLQFVNSEFLGTLVLMNTLVSSQKGILKLIVSKGSVVQNLFEQSKLERIIYIRTA